MCIRDRLYSVNDVFNGIFVHGNMLGDAMFYGSGAGKLPTASAVVADIIEEAKNLNKNVMYGLSEEKMDLKMCIRDRYYSCPARPYPDVQRSGLRGKGRRASNR